MHCVKVTRTVREPEVISHDICDLFMNKGWRVEAREVKTYSSTNVVLYNVEGHLKEETCWG